MMIEVSVCLFAALQNSPSSGSNWPLAIFLTSVNALTIYSDVKSLNPWIHYLAFGGVAILCCIRVFQLALRLSTEKRQLYLGLYIKGAIIFFVGFALWGLENALCDDTLRPLKQQIGLPGSLFLELHAYWYAYFRSYAIADSLAGTCKL
jgi:hypothetical protein